MGSEQTDLGVRQAVAVYFKNRVVRSWIAPVEETTRKARHNYVAISQTDRIAVKQNLLHLIVSSPSVLQVQLASALGTVLHSDFPDQWPEYMQNVNTLLQSDNARSVQGGLLALLEVVRLYKWKAVDDRTALEEIIKVIFPGILELGTKLVQQDSLEAAEMLRSILKTYKSAIHLHLSPQLQESSSIIPWGTLFLSVVQKPIPADTQPASADEREKFPWWRAKKWAYHNLNRLFSRYGSPSQLSSTMSPYTKFAQTFEKNFAPEILNVYLRQAEAWIQKEWLSDRTLHYIISYFDKCINPKSTWSLLKSHTESIIAHIIFPLMCFSEKDQEMWELDPIEYIITNIDFFDDVMSAPSAAIVFLKDIAQQRRKHSFLKILGFVNSVLEKALQAGDSDKTAREKHGAFKMISHLSDRILAPKSGVIDMMEPFLVSHVFPEFKSRHPFLREIACNLIQEFAVLEFKDPKNLEASFQYIMNALGDEELPVKTQAALALRPMFTHDEVRAAMTPNVGTIMQSFLNLQAELDLDTLSGLMGEFVEVFADELTPFALQTTQQLRDTYFRTMQEAVESKTNNDPNDPEADANFMDRGDDKTFAAMGVLKTISTLLMSLDGSPEMFQQLEGVLLPMIKFTFEHKFADLYDEIFEIIEGLTFISRAISPTMWTVFDLIYQAYYPAPDFFETMLPALDNYISFGSEAFAANQEKQRMLYEIVQKTMTAEMMSEMDRVAACKLMESVLLNCKGHVDSVIPVFLGFVMPYLTTPKMIKSINFRIQAIEVPINAIYYNPVAALRIFEENGWSNTIFNTWFSNIKRFSRVHDKKLIVLALCALIGLPIEQVPPTLQPAWPRLLQVAVEVLQSLPAAQKYRDELEETFMDGGEDDQDELDEDDAVDEEEDFDEDDDVQNEEDQAYLEMLAREAAKMENGIPEDDDADEELDEELDFHSPLADVDVYVQLQNALTTLQQSQPASYQVLTKDLVPEQQQFIMSVYQKAELSRLASA